MSINCPSILPSPLAPTFPHQYHVIHLIKLLPLPRCLRLQNNDAKPGTVKLHYSTQTQSRECDCNMSRIFLKICFCSYVHISIISSESGDNGSIQQPTASSSFQIMPQYSPKNSIFDIQRTVHCDIFIQ